MRNVVRLAVAICCIFAGLQAGPANAEKRFALTVGVDAYDNLPAHEQLRKAVNDARAMATALRGLGFEATVEENLPKLAFTRAWQRFLNRLQPGDTAVLFFAGHGVEIGGLNYLLLRDVPKVVPGEDRVLAEASVRFNTLMDDLRDRKVRVALFIIDACRDNPFRDGSGRAVGGGRGLARVEAAEGSFVMYSAGAGEQALDRLPGADTNPNSVYTRALLPILAMPGLSLPEIATRVREQVVDVARTAGRKQTPAYYDQLVGKFVLKASVDKPAPPLPQLSEAAEAWAAVKDTTSIPQLEVVASRYKGTVYADLAQARISELKALKLAVAPPPAKSAPPPSASAPAAGVTPLRPERERALKRGDKFKECASCPEMVVVPAGEFMPPGHDYMRVNNRVAIPQPFAVGKFEVTFAEWDACVAAAGCKHTPSDEGWGRSRRPVINVSLNDAMEYTAWLSGLTGKTYRLLTAEEFAYVECARKECSGYWWGKASSREHANYGADDIYSAGGGYYRGFAKGRDRWVNTAPIGQFPANPFGLYDVQGNVWEWVGSAGRPWALALGGSWHSSAPNGAGHLYPSPPPDHRAWDVGFRVARVIER